MKLKTLALSIAMIGAAAPALAQETTTQEKVVITGSSIKRIQSEGALPIQVITRKELERDGIVTAEQLVMSLNLAANGSDNLASNADVVTGAQRGNNGASSVNLRGQGADSTLVLLNGRRIASHGMKGQAVDVQAIPFAAIDRVEILKDGASAVYGTDAIGGVINFITRKDISGFEGTASADVTQKGGGNIGTFSLVGGRGNIDADGFNIMFSLSHTQNKSLRGDQRDFVNTFQSNKGLSVDTRGDPFATVFATSVGNSLFGLSTAPTSSGQIQPGTTTRMNGVNVLNLPGGAGCSVIPGMAAYDYKLWAAPASQWGCAWDTGRAAVLQQPVDNTNYVAKAIKKISGEHQMFVELVGSTVDVAKSFSPIQVSPSASTFNASSFYPKTGAAYDSVYNALVAMFPTIAPNYGLPIAYRWRCMPCGNREINTSTDSGRLLVGAEGPLWSWDYRVGLSQAYSDAKSTLGGGYYYQAGLNSALGSGLINPFLMPGQSQSAAGLALLDAASARGVTLYGGRTTTTQLDASASGEIMKLPAGPIMGAVGADIRKEQYFFNGDARAIADQAAINGAPFDNTNALSTVSRNINAIYAEVLVPVTKQLEVTLAARQDKYSGFGTTTNPKVSFRFVPVEELMFRGSYNTSFRVPSFNQLFNGVTESPYSGKDLVDPATCPTLKVDTTKAGCSVVTPTILTGGKSTLGPETAKSTNFGFVWQPLRQFSMNVDYWEIHKKHTIQSLDLPTMLANYNLFGGNFIRDTSGNLVSIDQRWINAGEAKTRGLEVGGKLTGNLGAGKWVAGLDGAYLLEKKSKVVESAQWGPSEVGRWILIGDLGLRWKHTAYFTYAQGDWSGTISNIYRAGYQDQVLPGVANGTVTPSDYDAKVKAYSIFNVSASYNGIKNMTVTVGIKNLLNTDPPFSVAYDSNSGAGSSWDPRVADPRGRSFNAAVSYKFN